MKTKQEINKIIELAKTDPSAMYTLAGMYFSGEGVKKSKSKCIELLERGAQLKEGECAYLLGSYYEKGLIVKKDYNKARLYYMIAYHQKHPLATYQLANFYQYGHGVYKDEEKAKLLFQEAKDLGVQE